MTLRRGPAEVRHTVIPVDVPGIARRFEERSGCAASDRNIRPAGDVEDHQGVSDHLVHAGIATDAGHRAQIHLGMQSCQQQRTRVVDTGVDVENDRQRAGLLSVERGHACTTVTGIDESAERSRADALRPLATI
jgi:hypothetical protein